ncbi:MAG TPA: vWA domain-containing protein [Gemmataceae bacterium]|nr:vWA domain-containing protein [Gemmataceae bacterium]
MNRLLSIGFSTLLGLLAGAVGAVPVPAAPVPDAPAPAAGKPIDVVICLDVSGSMNGLIDSAKTKLWDIINDLAKAKPTPQLRVGLYSYGHTSYDPKAGWVRKESDLITDLDVIYQKLFALTINGGTEYVARVCRDAVEDQKWSEDKDALKIIFVAGNEPATQDKEVTLNEVAAKAKAKGIIINTIYCKSPQFPNFRDWEEFAVLAGGKFMIIDQNRGTVAINTPMDKELTELGARLNTTYVRYGKRAEEKAANQLKQDLNAAQAAPGVAAARSVTKATALYRNDDWDLVDRMKNDPTFDITKLPESELSEEMRQMTPEQRVAHVKKMAAEREAIQKQIVELNARRQAYIAEQMKKNPSAADKAFDEAVRSTLREQAAAKGIKIPD